MAQSPVSPEVAPEPPVKIADHAEATSAVTPLTAETDSTWAHGEYQRLRDLAKPGPGGWEFNRKDAIAGVTTAFANIPDSMASAALAGVSPVHGLYALIVGLPLLATFASSQVMNFNVTSSGNLIAAAGMEGLTGENRVASLAMITLIAGLFQLMLGLLGLGQLTRFVSASVMTGFLTGIGIVIVLGQLWPLTGFQGQDGNSVAKTIELIQNLGSINGWETAVGIGTLVALFALERTKVATLGMLIALVGATLATSILLHFDIGRFALVEDLGDIPSGLPHLYFPTLENFGSSVVTGISVGAIGALVGMSVGQAFPNKDGREMNDSRDFMGQGMANIASSFVRGAAGNGAVGTTTISVRAGATSRWSAIIQGGVVLVALLLFADLLGKIPSCALAAILIYIGVLLINPAVIKQVARSSRISMVTMVLVILVMLFVPLHYAVLIGIVLDALFFLHVASNDIRLVKLTASGDHVVETRAPAVLEDNAVTTLDVSGSLFYAGAQTLAHLLPDPKTAQRVMLVLRLRGHRELGTTFWQLMVRYAGELEEREGRLILSGVDPELRGALEGGGFLEQLKPENVFFATEVIGGSTRRAVGFAQELLDSMPPLQPAEDQTERPSTPEIV